MQLLTRDSPWFWSLGWLLCLVARSMAYGIPISHDARGVWAGPPLHSKLQRDTPYPPKSAVVGSGASPSNLPSNHALLFKRTSDSSQQLAHVLSNLREMKTLHEQQKRDAQQKLDHFQQQEVGSSGSRPVPIRDAIQRHQDQTKLEDAVKEQQQLGEFSYHFDGITLKATVRIIDTAIRGLDLETRPPTSRSRTVGTQTERPHFSGWHRFMSRCYPPYHGTTMQIARDMALVCSIILSNVGHPIGRAG